MRERRENITNKQNIALQHKSWQWHEITEYSCLIRLLLSICNETQKERKENKLVTCGLEYKHKYNFISQFINKTSDQIVFDTNLKILLRTIHFSQN